VPDAKEQAASIWVELSELVDALADYLEAHDIEFSFQKGEQVPRLVATVDGVRYGLYAMAGARQRTDWVRWAAAGAKKVGPEIKPVLALRPIPVT
jgi:hypothetical protein